MISLAPLKKIAHNVHLDDLLKSMNECRKDNRGGFLIPASAKITDSDYAKYRHLPINWSIAPITAEDLPKEFSTQAVKTVDMFRRKTFDLPYECMILFDYKTGNIISCSFSEDSEDDTVKNIVYPDLIRTMHIASVHNHPNQYFSPPSSNNFQMLGFEFEDFELIFAKNELWILESREKVFSDEEIDIIRENANKYFDACVENVNCDFESGYLLIDNLDKCYGDRLLKYINNNFNNILLVRRFLHE